MKTNESKTEVLRVEACCADAANDAPYFDFKIYESYVKITYIGISINKCPFCGEKIVAKREVPLKLKNGEFRINDMNTTCV